MGLIVQKFGGSSVANAERVMNVARIVTETYKQGNDVIVVAMLKCGGYNAVCKTGNRYNSSCSCLPCNFIKNAGTC